MPLKTFHLIVKNRQREESVTAIGETLDTLLVKTKAAPIEGQANLAVIAAIAEYLGVAKSRISISSGAHSKTKRVTIRTD